MATALKQHTRLIYEAVTASHLPFLPVALHHRPSRGKGLQSEKSPTFQLIGRPCHSFSGQLLSPHGLFACHMQMNAQVFLQLNAAGSDIWPADSHRGHRLVQSRTWRRGFCSCRSDEAANSKEIIKGKNRKSGRNHRVQQQRTIGV